MTLNDYLKTLPAELGQVLSVITDACRVIRKDLQLGALADMLGSAGAENVQGETQKKLDVIANDLLKARLLDCSAVAAIASEEEEHIVAGKSSAPFLVAYDPLDGSSNIDINSMVGTIFSILPAPAKSVVDEQDFLQPGHRQAAAGYVLYGPSVMLALTTGKGTSLYTLDPRSGEFVQTVAQVGIAPDTREFAINMSNQRFWAPGMQQYIADLIAGSDGPRKKNFNMRWVAAMVADVHRVLCRGGLFTYPWDSREPGKAGKLRLLYEANPMAFLVEQAGGSAWTPEGRILDIPPVKTHQRVPVILGSANEVKICVDYHRR